MICEKCGINTATTHIRTVVNGKVYERHLCSKCASREENNKFKIDDFTNILSNMFSNVELPSENKITRCSCCGSSFADITNSGKCGCAECYKTFYTQLVPYFKRVHGDIQHIGKKAFDVEGTTKIETIDELRCQLKKLIEQENYEQAAVVRDKIKSLQEGVQ